MILVTGGCGFIGSHLVNHLVEEQGLKVMVLDNLSNSSPSSITSNATFIHGDIRDVKLVKNILAETTLCYHLAAKSSVPECERDHQECIDINLVGSINIFKQAINSPLKPGVIYASSSAVYGNPPSTKPLAEEDALAPVNVYGVSKLQTEIYAKYLSQSQGLKSIGLRFFNVYGYPFNPYTKYDSVMNAFLKALLHNRDLVVNGDGENVRDFIYIKDLLSIFNALRETPHVIGQIYNVCSEQPTKIIDLANSMKKMFPNSSSKVIHAPENREDIKFSLGSAAKLKGSLPHLKIHYLQDCLQEICLRAQE